jgi:hypothetical protein
MLLLSVTQIVPVAHAALELHVGVQRKVPPGVIGLHTSGDAQSLSTAQRSSS